VPASRFRCKEHLVPDPASEHTTSLCEIAWLGRFHSEQAERLLRLRKHMCRASRGARHSRSKEELAGQTGTIAHSCGNAWQEKFVDLSIALTETSTHSGHKSERDGARQPKHRHDCFGFAEQSGHVDRGSPTARSWSRVGPKRRRRSTRALLKPRRELRDGALLCGSGCAA
jgi:hypothetical protein